MLSFSNFHVSHAAVHTLWPNMNNSSFCYFRQIFIKIGSHVRRSASRWQTPITAECPVRRHCHGNQIMADMSGTWWDVTSQVSSQLVHCYVSYGISNIFKRGGRPPFWIFRILIFDHVTVIVVLICCCIPNFNKIGSHVRPPDADNCRMYNAPLLGNGRCHGNGNIADMSKTRWDVTTQVASVGPLLGELWHFEYFPTWRPSAILNF